MQSGESTYLSASADDADDPEAVGDFTKTEQENASCVTSKALSIALLQPTVLPSGSGIVPRLHNVVATVDLKCELDLMKIALRIRTAEYNPKRFHAVVARIREPRTAALIFRSGKLVVTGAHNETCSHLATRKYARILQKLGFNVQFANFKIQNIVASCDVRFPIQLERLYSSQVQFANYEPELFPGVIYRMLKPKAVLLIFVTGKIVLTGCKSRAELSEAFENIYPVLRSFRKQ